MVAHLVHRDSDGHLAVVAVLLKAGTPSPLIETLWKNVPKEKGKEREVHGVEVNAADLLPANRAAYYTFTGSLTTPPCDTTRTRRGHNGRQNCLTNSRSAIVASLNYLRSKRQESPRTHEIIMRQGSGEGRIAASVV